MKSGGAGGGGNGLRVLFVALLTLAPAPLLAQVQPPSQTLSISGKSAWTWTESGTSVIVVDGPVTITLERATLTAQQAVIWLDDVRGAQGGQPGAQAGEESATIALLGNAKIQQPQVTRTDQRLVATARVNGTIRITAENRLARDVSTSQTYVQAMQLRRASEAQQLAAPAPAPGAAPNAVPGAAPGAESQAGSAAGSAASPPQATVTIQPTVPPTQTPPPPTTAPASTTRPNRAPVNFSATNIEQVFSDGRVAFVLSGGVKIYTAQNTGEHVEMQAQRAVIFTVLEHLRDIAGSAGGMRSVNDAVVAAYLEGDVRIVQTPNPTATPPKAESRLEANRVYYQFGTQQAVLTDAILHTYDLQRNIPLIVRARRVKQLSDGEWTARRAELTTSSFAVPSYSIRADKAYVRQEDTGDPRLGTRTVFHGEDITMRAFGVPFFYLPLVGGSVTERGAALRDLEFGNSRNFGWFAKTEWGLLEALGYIPPQDLDISVRADYYSDRGPAGGLDAKYGGGFVSETAKQPWNFDGEFRSYFVPMDDGIDILGHRRGHIDPPDDFRGRVAWEHQHFFPDDWQLQVRSGWVSDATFLEEWFEDEFNDGLPLESSLYLKRQRDTEAMTFLTTVQPNNVVTSTDWQQEQFEIERVPQLGYHRIGDSWWNDRLTFFSDNTVERVRFNESGASLGDQGFRFKQGARPGLPAQGVVGWDGLNGAPPVTEDFTDRADFRQELDYPFSLGEFKVVPYVMGRYTWYSESPEGGAQNRVYAGTGVKINTQFWKVDNAPESELFDVHRVRHVVEPEVHLWSSATNVDPDELWIYDEPIDKTYDLQAVQVALRQRWQTKRGGPGRWRSVDFLTLNVDATFYANQPPEAERIPSNFRGFFYSSLPEASIPRESVNADVQWRISDTTVLLGDAQWNLDTQDLATASVGFIAQRGQRMTYFLGYRFINDLDSKIATIAASYQLTAKYSIGMRYSFDFGNDSDVYSAITINRRFDKFFMMVTVFHDENENDSGISFALFPEGLGAGASTDQLNRVFGGGAR